MVKTAELMLDALTLYNLSSLLPGMITQTRKFRKLSAFDKSIFLHDVFKECTRNKYEERG